MDYNCNICSRNFGENRIKYEYHLTTSQHKRKAEKCNVKLEENTNTAQLLELVKQLTAQVQVLQANNNPAPVATVRPTKEPLSFTHIIKNKIFTIDEMLQRSNPELLKPDTTWIKFIFNAYKYKSRETHITCEYKPHEIAANLLLTKFYQTPQELLPIIVLNNDRGKNKKICYYSTGGKFDVKTNISKKENIDLYNRIDMYIFKSFCQSWEESKLRDIYRDLPIELKNKIHFQTSDENKLSFLDFKCCCTDTSHRGCYREMIIDDDRCKLWRYKDHELINIDGGKFTLTDDDYFDFVSEYVNAIEDHEYAHVYNDFREQKELARFDEEAEKQRYRIVDEVYELILEKCLYVVRDEDE